jgi:hypothetical protein
MQVDKVEEPQGIALKGPLSASIGDDNVGNICRE